MAVVNQAEWPIGTYMVRIDRITIGERHREPSDVSDLVASIKHVGLLQPIVLNTNGHLIAGRHRILAHQELGKEWINATITDLDVLHAELAELEENLNRSDISALERSEHVTRRGEILWEM